MDVIWQMQKAIYEKLSSDEVLSGMITGIFHSVPQNTAFPYINIGKSEVADASNQADKVYKVSYEIKVFSHGRSNSQLLEIIDKTVPLLTDINSISAVNYQLLNGKIQSVVVEMLDNGLIWQGTAKLEYVLKTVL